MQASITALPHRALIRITGPDWAPFLKGLCTAHIDDIVRDSQSDAPIRLYYGAFLRPQGKVYADCLIQAVAADDIRLDVPLSAREELLAKLNMYKLRAKVTIEALDTPVCVALGGMPAGFTADPRSEIVGTPFGRLYEPCEADAREADWTAFRYRLGVAEAGQDFDKDQLYAIDANLDLLGGIDFHKGCYVGQELTSRMKRRGQIKNRILPLTHGGMLERGAEVLNGDLRAGEVLASVDGISLALMRLDRMEGELSIGGKMIKLHVPSWLASSVKTIV